MRTLLDSSVLVAALLPHESEHLASAATLREADRVIHSHALNETFSTLTGGSLGYRLDADVAARLIREKVIPHAEVIALGADEISDGQSEARARGVRGGAIHDFMHLVAAKKAGCAALSTLDTSDFLSFRRKGDPEIQHP